MTSPLLGQLQSLDSNTDRARERVAEIERLLADHAALNTAEANARAAHDIANERRAQVRDRELELKTLETRIADLDQKLYSGRIRNAKELEGFERESRMFKQNRDKLEGIVLGLMDASDGSEREAQVVLQTLESVRGTRAQSELQWQHELDELRAQVSQWERTRDNLSAEISDDDLRVYDRVRKRNATAVVPVRGQHCGACSINVSTDVLERARDEATLVQCDNCSRILYVESQRT